MYTEPAYTWDENPSSQPVSLTTEAIRLLTGAIETEIRALYSFSGLPTTTRKISRLRKLHARLSELL